MQCDFGSFLEKLLEDIPSRELYSLINLISKILINLKKILNHNTPYS